MNIKIKCEQILCHGCLSEDRIVHRISGDISEMFYELRNDKLNKSRLELVLCWECVAFLKKLKVFKARIKTAQCLLMQYIKCYCKNDPIPRLSSLSSLYKLHNNIFDYEFEEEEKPELEEIRDQDEEIDVPMGYNDKELEDLHQNENMPSEDLLTDIKVEYDDSMKEKKNDYLKEENNDSIKEEYNSSNDNDFYYEPGSKIEVEKSEDKSYTPKKRHAPFWMPIKSNYQKFATVTVRKDIWKRTYLKFAKPISLDHKEYEKVLKRDENRYRYPKMPYKCEECKVGYLKRFDLQRHKTLCHSNELTFPYKCADCPTIVTSLEQQEQHWAAAHSKQYKCTICTEVHQSTGEIRNHLNSQHRRNYACKECDFDCGTIIEFRRHYQTTHEIAICNYCNKEFQKKKFLISHIRVQHTPVYCTICKRSYTNKKSFKSHQDATHPEQSGTVPRKELSYCVECNKQFKSELKYQMHLKSASMHVKDRLAKVPCTDCGKMMSKLNIKNHYRFMHLKITKHHCNLCDKHYSKKAGLREHIDRFHNKIAHPKNKVCDICGRAFSTNKILTNHRRTHTGERPYKCQYCAAAFAQRCAMKAHEKSQHKNVARPSQPT